MKQVLGFSAAGLLGILIGVPLSAPCVTGCSVDEAADTEATASQPQSQTPTQKQTKTEDTMFGLFGNSGPDAKQLINEGALVIDVRTQEEWNEGHLSMAKLMPVDQMPARLKEVEGWTSGNKNKPIVVHCRSGARSGRAQAILKNAGFTNVVNGGGYSNLR